MNDTATAKIAAVSHAETLGGLTPELAARWWDQLGSKHLAIVELKVADHTENATGDLALKLTILHLEPATQPAVTDHLRNLQRALYTERTPQGDIDSFEDIEPKVTDILTNAGNVVHVTEDGQPLLATFADEPEPIKGYYALDATAVKGGPTTG